MICSVCAFNITKLTEEMATNYEGATLDCPNCDSLLIIKSHHLREFHSYLHESTKGAWPVDGKGTGYIEC